MSREPVSRAEDDHQMRRRLFDLWSTVGEPEAGSSPIAVVSSTEPQFSIIVWEVRDDVDIDSVTTLVKRSDCPVLPIWTTSGQVQIGPWIGAAFDYNCIRCVVGRRLSRRIVRTDIRSDIIGRSASSPASTAARPPGWVRLTACAIAADEIAGYSRRRPKLRCSTIELDATTLATTVRPAFRDRGCRSCSVSTSGGREEALRAILDQSSADRGDADDPEGCVNESIETIVDPKTGLVDAIGDMEGSPLPAVVTTLRMTSALEPKGPILSAGRSESIGNARRKALYEALERYCAAWPSPDRVFAASYGDLGHLALNPGDLVLHSPDQYRRPGFRYEPFCADDMLDWTWSWDAVNDEWRALPLQSVYYGVEKFGVGPAFAMETSTGWALGRNLTDASIRGLLEVMERHAFLMSWYCGEVRGSIPMSVVSDPRVAWLRRRLASRGYELRLLDIRSRCGVPAVWAMALGSSADGATVAAVSGLAADVSPDRAVWRATLEACTGVVEGERGLRAAGDKVSELARDHRTVASMTDHLMFYSDFRTRRHLEFALDAGPSQSWPAAGLPAEQSLEDSFGSLLATLDKEEVNGRTRVFVTDTTTPEARIRGLRSVRVTVPGMLPMTFGYGMERLEGASAIRTALGGRDHNRIPHAFA